MGARQSKRSVDITTTPKKEGIPAEGGVVGDAAAPGDGKLERIEEADTKPTTNGIAPHTDTAEDKDKDKDEATEKDKEQQPQQEEVKAEETKQESSGDSSAEVAEVTTPTEAAPASPNTATSPDNKETKKKDKKKKWSFRSISFSKKDKTKPNRDETPKNGDVTKEEPLAEGGEDAENATAAASSPVEEKSAASSPSADEQVAAPVAAEPKEEAAATSPAAAASAAAAVAASPVEEKKKEPTPSAPTPIPSVEDKKEEAVEKVEAEKKIVEVSQSTGGHSVADPVEIPVYRVQPVATPSIIERKASEDLPSLPPSSPPPTPIDPSPLQQARQAAASATALAEALKLPAVVAGEEEATLAPPPDVAYPPSREDVLPQESRASKSIITASTSPTSLDFSTDNLPPTEATFVLAEVECLPVAEAEIEVETSQDYARKVGDTLETKVEGNVAMKEEVSKCQKSEASKAKESSSEGVEKIPDVVAMAEVMNEALPAVECQIKNEINSSEVAMKINVPPNAGDNEKVEAVTLLSAEIETKDVCPAVKQYLSSKNMRISPDKTTQCEESIEKLSDSGLLDAEKPSEVVPPPSAKLIESSSLEQSSAEAVEQLRGSPIDYDHDYAKYAPKEEEGIASAASPTELFINSEEGPLSVSEDIVVEAKPALIIPEDDSVEELTDTIESVKVIPETDEEKLENELESDTALPTEETLISEDLEDMSVPEDATVEPFNELVGMPNSIMKNEMKAVNVEDTLPCPPEDLAAFSSQIPKLQNTANAIETEPIVNEREPIAISASAIEAEPHVTSPERIEQTEEIKKCPLSPKDRVTSPEFCSLDDSESTHRLSSLLSDAPMCSLSEKHSSEPQTLVLSPEPESVPISLEDLPPAPEDTGTQSLDSFDYPLPPEELSCPLLLIAPPNVSVAELPPAPVEHAASPIDPTETLLTPPISPNFQQSSITSGIATETTTKDHSQISSHNENDSSNREQLVLLSEPLTMSCDQSDIKLKERLAAECVAKTESQEEALSGQLSNTIPSTAAKKHHQNAPEVEAPVENNVAHDVSTTESADEAPKVAPPAVPTEAPASPPTAPAITEDVASVTKAIEEIDISDKAVAAAVNEAIECNTNEIIADAHHQNNINE